MCTHHLPLLLILFSRRHATLELTVLVGWSVGRSVRRLVSLSVTKLFFIGFPLLPSAHPSGTGGGVYGLIAPVFLRCLLFFLFFMFFFFLRSTTCINKRLCPSVGWLVGRSVGRSVTHSLKTSKSSIFSTETWF